MPREILSRLGVKYRRIPALSIGKDIYCDSRMIIPKLESLYPENKLGSSDPFLSGVEEVLSNFINDAGPFWRAAQMIPPSMISEEFAKDRSEMTGRTFQKEGRERDRPEAMSHVRMYFEIVEKRFLGDGRGFLLGGDSPGLADVHVAWNLDWAVGLAGLKQEGEMGELFTKEQFPKVWAWLDRYKTFISKIHEKDGRAPTISVDETEKLVLGSEFGEPEGEVDPLDPLQLKKGELVEMFPTDSGMNHHDKGELVAIGVNEVVVKSEVPGGKGHLRIHYPRTNFKIQQVSGEKL
jgi:glutathione S-transferase